LAGVSFGWQAAPRKREVRRRCGGIISHRPNRGCTAPNQDSGLTPRSILEGFSNARRTSRGALLTPPPGGMRATTKLFVSQASTRRERTEAAGVPRSDPRAQALALVVARCRAMRRNARRPVGMITTGRRFNVRAISSHLRRATATTRKEVAGESVSQGRRGSGCRGGRKKGLAFHHEVHARAIKCMSRRYIYLHGGRAGRRERGAGKRRVHAMAESSGLHNRLLLSLEELGLTFCDCNSGESHAASVACGWNRAHHVRNRNGSQADVSPAGPTSK
jgi:hypothetical protein